MLPTSVICSQSGWYVNNGQSGSHQEPGSDSSQWLVLTHSCTLGLRALAWGACRFSAEGIQALHLDFNSRRVHVTHPEPAVPTDRQPWLQNQPCPQLCERLGQPPVHLTGKFSSKGLVLPLPPFPFLSTAMPLTPPGPQPILPSPSSADCSSEAPRVALDITEPAPWNFTLYTKLSVCPLNTWFLRLGPALGTPSPNLFTPGFGPGHKTLSKLVPTDACLGIKK